MKWRVFSDGEHGSALEAFREFAASGAQVFRVVPYGSGTSPSVVFACEMPDQQALFGQRAHVPSLGGSRAVQVPKKTVVVGVRSGPDGRISGFETVELVDVVSGRVDPISVEELYAAVSAHVRAVGGPPGEERE